jgi:O-antigen/teichoic acid export membrane protein
MARASRPVRPFWDPGGGRSMTDLSSPGTSEAGPNADDASSAPSGVRRRGGGLFFFSALVSQASALLRYVVLARLLGPEQLGIAATLVVTASFFDMISDTGSERFLIQDRHGGTKEVQKLVHLVYVARGAFSALGLVLFALPIAWFYHTPQLAGGMAILALSPLISGFQHLDNRRIQRHHDFRSEAVSITASELVGLAVTLAAAWFIRDFTAVLYGVIARAFTLVVTSQLQAERPYRLGWSADHAPRLSRFAAPLMLNGLMLFVATQGDRVLVGHQLGVKALGFYSAVLLMIYYPAGLLVRYLFAINIPLIAAERDRPAERTRVIDLMGGQTLLVTVAMAAGFAVVAPPLVPLLFGGRFAQAPLLVGLIGCLQSSRFLLNWPTTVALATGRSVTVLLSNLAHGFAFAGALLGLRLAGDLTGLVGGFVAGELLAVAVALVLVNRNLDRPPLDRFDRLGATAAAFALIVGADLALAARQWTALGVLALLSVGLAAWLCRREQAVILEAVATGRRLAAPLLLRLKMR